MEVDPMNPNIKAICVLKAHWLVMGFMHMISAMVESGDLEGLHELGQLLKNFAERKLKETEFKLENV